MINLFPIAKVVFMVPKRTMSTIVLTAFGDNLSLGLMKLPAALFIISDGVSPNKVTH